MSKYQTILQVAREFYGFGVGLNGQLEVVARVWACPDYATTFGKKVDYWTNKYMKTEIWVAQAQGDEIKTQMVYRLQQAVMVNAAKEIGMDMWVASFIRDTYLMKNGSLNGLFEALGYLK